MRFANEYGYCELNDFPGCSQIVVSNHAFVYPKHRGKGHGRHNHRLRLQRATDLGYDLIIATIRVGNEAEESIVKTEGWQEVFRFINSNTGNTVGIWVKQLVRN